MRRLHDVVHSNSSSDSFIPPNKQYQFLPTLHNLHTSSQHNRSPHFMMISTIPNSSPDSSSMTLHQPKEMERRWCASSRSVEFGWWTLVDLRARSLLFVQKASTSMSSLVALMKKVPTESWPVIAVTAFACGMSASMLHYTWVSNNEVAWRKNAPHPYLDAKFEMPKNSEEAKH